MRSDYRVYRYDRLDAPVVTAGSSAVLIGAQNGLFPDMGLAVPGEMGGLWAGEKKVCDGFFLAIDDVPLTQADACEIHPVVTAFHYRMQKQQLHVVRRQFIPDGVSGCVVELTIENLKNAPRMVEVSFTVRTDILTAAAARGEDGAELGRDVGEYDEQEQAFFARDSRNPWHAVWGADANCRVLQADLPQSVYGFGNTQGKGVNGRLFYRLRLAANGQAAMRLYIAGGYPSRSKAEEALALLREKAETLLAEKRARIDRVMARSAATMPSAALEQSVNWAKLYADWLVRTLPRGGCALCCDLPEHPALYGEGWAKAMEALLPLGGAARVQEMLHTLVGVSADANCRVLQADLPQSVYGFGNTQGKGVNGRLFYRLRLAANGQAAMRLYIAGGYPSRSKAEEALALLREKAETLLAEKRARIDRVMARSAATMPSAALEQSVNWAKLYADWLVRTLPRGGCALCCDLPEHPALYGEGWAKAMEALLPLGGAARVQEMLHTLVGVSAQAQMAPGRLARSVSLSGKVLQVGGERESAQFVALVHRTLLWSGDKTFAAAMLPMTGLCINYLRRSTKGFEDVQEDMLEDVRAALVGHAYILNLTGADDAPTLALLEKLPAQREESDIAPNATLAERAKRHGEHVHCLLYTSPSPRDRG